MPIATGRNIPLVKSILIGFTSILLATVCYSQQTGKNEDAYFVKLAAGEEYKRGKLHQWLWGKNHRREWSTTISVKIVMLDTIFGGLTAYKKGGGNESKTLRLRSAAGKEYVLRSVNKSRQAVIPTFFRGTMIGNLVQDGVSQSHPFGAFAIPIMSTAAGINHTNPLLVYIPEQPALTKYNDRYGNDLYILEERPDGDWSDNKSLGGFSEFESTLKLVKKMKKGEDIRIDQPAYIKSRLFDILLSDWDRQQDNWRWGRNDKKDKIYQPLSRDRDQAFFTSNGKMNKLVIRLMHIRFMQQFEHRIKNVKLLTSQDRDMDKIFANAMMKEHWLSAAKYLQQVFTDDVITASVQQLPVEIFAVSGKELIEKLKSRRNELHSYAMQFYEVLARNVDINGSEKNEYFVVKKAGNDLVEVKVFRVKNGEKEQEPYYYRLFSPTETRRIRLYGFGGEDQFNIDPGISEISIVNYKGENKNHLFKEDDD